MSAKLGLSAFGAVLLSALLLIPGLAAPEEGRPVGLMVKVKSVAKDGKSFLFKAKGGTTEVTWNKKTKIFQHESKMLSELGGDTELHLLAYKAPVAVARGGGQWPETFRNVQAIVAASDDEFDPPRVPTELSKARIRWYGGKFKNQKKRKEYWIDNTLLQTGRDRVVLVINEAESKSLAAKQQLFVAGKLRVEGRKKFLKATEIIIVSRKFPAKEYKLTHDFENRKARVPTSQPDF